MTQPGRSAQWYAKTLSWHVFPVAAGDKTPLTAHGFQDATVDQEQIQSWWVKWSDANLGLACGPSELVVLDFDVEKDGYEGAQLLAKLLADHPSTTAATGGGGYHLVYLQPEGFTLGNGRRGMPAGVDVRGEGGYIVLPPSVHPSGRHYAWLTDRGPHELPPQPLPDFLLEMLRPPERSTQPITVPPVNGHGTPYGDKALQDELDALARASEGGRNEQLNRSAFNLGQLIGGGVLDEANVRPQVLNTALAIGLPEKEAQRTIASGLRAGMAEPRGVPVGPLPAQPIAHGNGGTKPPVDVNLERLTDLGNGRRFARIHGPDLRWVYEWGWLLWTGNAWEFDRTGEVMRRAKLTAMSFLSEHATATEQARQVSEEAKAAVAAEDTDTAAAKTEEGLHLHKRAEALLRWARKCQTRARLEAMVALAQSEPPIPVLAADFDNEPWLLNVQNGTLDLRTGRLRDHDRKDLLTVTAPVHYNPAATCPTWLAFLDRIMAGDAELIEFLQRMVGYSLTGDVSEQKLFFAWGTGANGKSTFVNTILAMLGKDYAAQAAPDLLTVGKNRHPTELADLRGKRLVASIEVDEGKRLAEGLVKQLTGGDKVKARYMRQDFFQFDPTHKLLLVANHKPVIRGTDHAIWRRICLIPFDVTIPESEQDKALPGKLQAELPGILKWAVDGCMEWRRRGLAVPASVVDATEHYRNESDTLGAFLEECTVEGNAYEAKAGDLYKAYREWCEDNGERAVTNKTLGKQLADRGYCQTRNEMSSDRRLKMSPDHRSQCPLNAGTV